MRTFLTMLIIIASIGVAQAEPWQWDHYFGPGGQVGNRWFDSMSEPTLPPREDLPSGLRNLDSRQLAALAELKRLCLEERAGKFKPMAKPTPCEGLEALGIKEQLTGGPAIDWEGRMIGRKIARLPENHPDRKAWIEMCSHLNVPPHSTMEPRPVAICEGLKNP